MPIPTHTSFDVLAGICAGVGAHARGGPLEPRRISNRGDHPATRMMPRGCGPTGMTAPALFVAPDPFRDTPAINTRYLSLGPGVRLAPSPKPPAEMDQYCHDSCHARTAAPCCSHTRRPVVALAGSWQAQVTITAPTANQVLPAGTDFATDVIGDRGTVQHGGHRCRSRQKKAGRARVLRRARRRNSRAGKRAANGSHINFLERAYWGITTRAAPARASIRAACIRSLSQMSSTGDNTQQARVYWFTTIWATPDG